MNQLFNQSNKDITSLDVSRQFGKRHEDVMQAIKNMQCSMEFRVQNFKAKLYLQPNPDGGISSVARMYEISPVGFMHLCENLIEREYRQGYESGYRAAENGIQKGALTESYWSGVFDRSSNPA